MKDSMIGEGDFFWALHTLCAMHRRPYAAELARQQLAAPYTVGAFVGGMGVFMVFSAGLSWLRQYLVQHTGNRVDAVLGASVFERLFKLPPMYFQHRPTGVIAARLQGVETIREFVASAAVTLILDFPFLLIFVGIMFYYSMTSTLIVLAMIGLIAILSLVVAPLLQKRLQEQFLLGARNQAFLTEYVAGMETVKSLQLEPQLNSRYSNYLAAYLGAGFVTRQLANTYNTASNPALAGEEGDPGSGTGAVVRVFPTGLVRPAGALPGRDCCATMQHDHAPTTRSTTLAPPP